MPELPEVEITKRILSKHSVNKVIKDIEVRNDNLRYKVSSDFIKIIKGSKIKKILRRSKYILFYLDNNYVVIAHLGMSGKILLQLNNSNNLLKTSFYFDNAFSKHDHLEFIFSDNTKMIYNDPRRFGFFILDKLSNLKKNKFLRKLGPEPFNKIIQKETTNKMLKSKKNIKNLLMDQTFMSGIGNIYANEILFASSINPNRISSNLNNYETQNLFKNIKIILKKAIKLGGSSIKDFKYLDGKSGKFQNEFKVYNKENLKCPRKGCNGIISRVVSVGRATFFCIKCQK